MAMVGILFPVVGLVGLVGFIWLCVVAFRRGPGWGLLVLFLSPIAAVIFAIKYWQESKKPFLVYAGSCVACVAVLGAMVATVGLHMTRAAQDVAQMDPVLDQVEPTPVVGALDPQQEAEVRQVQQSLREMQGQSSDVAGSAAQPHDAPEPVAAVDTALPAVAGGAGGSGYLSDLVPPGFHSVPVGQAVEHVGKNVRVVSNTGQEIRGKLTDAGPKMLLLERDLGSGTISFEMAAAEIKTLLVAYK